MKEITGNLWDHIGYADAICITTNGFVKSNGECVMGRGCAKEATVRWPKIARWLGQRIQEYGNVPTTLINQYNIWVCSFPVKPVTGICNETKSNVVKHMQKAYYPGSFVPGWACAANIEIIESSAAFLADRIDALGWTDIVIPRPGCGAGELAWEDVKPVLEKHLDDRFSIITWR